MYRPESTDSPWDTEDPIREELFSIERLEQHAESLATAQHISMQSVPRRALGIRLQDNEAVLLDAYAVIAHAVREGQSVTLASEWLIDNYHIVEKQIREVRDDLPSGYYRQLPKLADGPFAGYPRVFGIAWAFVAHTDSRFDADILCRFVRAYQKIQPLTIGELWAVAITLRIVLVENLRRAAKDIVINRAAQQEADTLADRLLGMNGQVAEPGASVLQKYEQEPLLEAFVVQLVQRLRDQDPKVTPALVWLEDRLTALNTTGDELAYNEHQRQGATSVTTQNIITSMRHISDVDWTELFERISPVDDVLRAGSRFATMDFPTRNLYRSAIEELSRGSLFTELEIAQKALLAASTPNNPIEQEGCALRERDPGYYLISGGRPAFEKSIDFHAPLSSWLARFNAKIGICGYICSILIVTTFVLLVPLLSLAHLYVGNWTLGILAFFGLIPAMDMAIAFVNRLVISLFGAALLPGLELTEGVPESLRTIVVVPTMLGTKQSVEEQIEGLEIHYLASQVGDVYFALLSDWTDAPTEHTAEDDVLLQLAVDGIARLNDRYSATSKGERFFLLHRRRIWNEGEKKWIGWERKRGKLHELNQLLRGATDTTFMTIGGKSPMVPSGVRYVITLDSDTRLPRETVRKLIGKMAHPLNQPRFDEAARRVIEGYAMLQPRVTSSLPVGCEGSQFQRIFSSMSGIDPYASAVSDVYQDLFDEGSYIGKGIYDVDAFEAALNGRVADSTLLSHDLFEGIFARSGLVSDIEVVEAYPSRFDIAAARQHRWARGDWQLLPWIMGRSDVSLEDKNKNHLSLIGRWKMLDNLRRTLSSPSSVIALLIGWTLPLPVAIIWTGFILLTITVPTLFPLIAAFLPRHTRITARSHLRVIGTDLWLAFCQTMLAITFLAYQAWSMTDAICRTLFRLFVSHQHLLEWVTSAHTRQSPRLYVIGFYRKMKASVVLSMASVLVLQFSGSNAWPIVLPFVVLWSISPAIALWTSISPRKNNHLLISSADRRHLRLIARRTWRYFETFVTSTDHMLPPDNFQEDPKPILAHRTSPTNMGLYLLSIVSARDFGWIGTSDTVDRLEATLATMGELPRFRGHFYNWYDTKDLHPLSPRYVSSVDSGNLAGHLIALANACRDWSAQPIMSVRTFVGIKDALCLAGEALQDIPRDRRMELVTHHDLQEALAAIETTFGRAPPLTADIPLWLENLRQQTMLAVDIAQALTYAYDDEAHAETLFWIQAAQLSIDGHRRDIDQSDIAAQTLIQRLITLEQTAQSMAKAMDFRFLFDQKRKLLSIGYLVSDERLDVSCYDLLASEARLASFMAIAKGDIPSQHWLRLGRSVTPIEDSSALISWSGSMFEYLMPALVMRDPAGSLLDQTNRLIIHRQMSYGNERELPWGISESAYNARDFELTYQYLSFGVPGLGLKRGLSGNAVIAPYATALAAMIEPAAAVKNFGRLALAGACGRYGFYEALDYTRSRLPEGRDHAIIYAYMAHHQGMTIVAIANALLDAQMQTRFHAEPIVQATELLLQERTPRDVAVARPWAEEVRTGTDAHVLHLPLFRRFRSAQGPEPAVHLLSNSRYTVMLTAAGSGYSRWRNLGITRWREDVTRDDWGSYIFLRDIRNGNVWTAGYQPSGIKPDSYDVRFSEDKAEFTRRDGLITTVLEIVVSPETDAEVRRLSISNKGLLVRDIEVTSYAELVLASPAADIAHPAFLKLFVQTEYDSKTGVILATRRRRSQSEPEICVAHLAIVEGETIGDAQIETDRARFLGRGRDASAPIAVMDGRPLSNTVGTVLDPIFSFRHCVRVRPGETVRVAFWTLVASSRADLLNSVDKHLDPSAFERAATLAWTQAQVQLRHLGITAEEAILFQHLAGHVIYANPSMRPMSSAIIRGAGDPAALWSQGISGDLPIVLIRIDDITDISIVGQLLRAHDYWRMKQLAVDLVILNEQSSSYVQDLHKAIETMVRTSQSRPCVGAGEAQGSVYVLRADLISQETRARLPSVARIVLTARQGNLSDQLYNSRKANDLTPSPHRSVSTESTPIHLVPSTLDFFNGLGGFTKDGRDYVTILSAGQATPAPWLNVIANTSFGFQVTVEGGGYTWSMNSRENQLTPWANDPVSDRPGEVIYLRDEDNGVLWGPMALPIREELSPYIVTHGQGYSRFEHTAHDIKLDLLQYVPVDDPIKISRLKISNLSSRTRRLSITTYVEWVLGSSRSALAPFIVTEIDSETGALMARNPWNATYGARVAFIDLAGQQTSWTGDRREFLGRNGTLSNPRALSLGAVRLSKKVGAGYDPCGVLQAPVKIKPGETIEVVFFLGEAASVADVQALITRYRAIDLDASFRDVVQHWDDLLDGVQVKTPDHAMDIMLNRWLLYQTLVCRLWARSALYQSSGAYGFRDQLQDGMALVLSSPAITRAHILRAAARQFTAGDVQHWWLPPFGQGVRTRISDDRVWLAYTVAHYITITGDREILNEQVPFLEGQPLQSSENESYFQPAIAEETASLFEHCARALDQSLGVGVHGLPLMGAGDWNDGMNRVGELGRGESVWLGWFLHAALTAFVPLADSRQEETRSAVWTSHAQLLLASLERDGWDGRWYRRGFFDDGTVFGSASSDECRIDSIAQSWSVISNAADSDHAQSAMASVEENLIYQENGLALLFAPPFNHTSLDPGYIKGYPPGIRENGGQYTHAAAWAIIAYARLGEGGKATDLFSLINPISHADTRAAMYRYKVEPYVVAADVYSESPHIGRGGWTWYTGAAGWMYQAGIDSILGLRRQGMHLLLTPCIPKNWPRFEIVFKYLSTRYEIIVENPQGVCRGVISLKLDGQTVSDALMRIPLVDDGKTHSVRAILGD